MKVKKKKKIKHKKQRQIFIQTNDDKTTNFPEGHLLFSQSKTLEAMTSGNYKEKGTLNKPFTLQLIDSNQLKLINKFIHMHSERLKQYLEACNIDDLNQLVVASDFLGVRKTLKSVGPYLVKQLQNPNVLNAWIKAGWNELLIRNEALSDYIKQYLKRKRNITPTPQYLRRNKPKLSNILKGHNAEISLVQPSIDCTMIASEDWDGTVKIWNVKTGNEMNTIRTGHTNPFNSVVFSSGRKILTSVSVVGEIKFWDIKTGTEIRTFTGHEGTVSSLAFNPDGTVLASGSTNGTIKFLNVEKATEIRTFTGHEGTVSSLVFNQNGTMLASGSMDKTVKIWNVETGIKICTLTGHKYYVLSVVFRPDGKMLASTQFLGKIKFWNVKTGTEILTFPKNIKLIAFSPDSTMLAFVSYDSKVKFLNIETGNEICTFNENASFLNSIAFNPDSTMFVLGSRDNTIRIFSLINFQDKDIQQLSTLNLLLISARQSFEITDLKQTYPELYKIYNQSSDPAKALMTQAKKKMLVFVEKN